MTDHPRLELSVGDDVVHSLHGTGRVVREGQREHRGKLVRYLSVRYGRDDLTVSFPAETAGELGLRRPISSEVVPAVLEELTTVAVRSSVHFVQRMRDHEEALRSGDPVRVAAIIRDLHAREVARRLAPSEAGLKREAIRMLVGEIAAALGASDAEVHELITSRLPPIVRRQRGRPRTRSAA